MQSPINVGSLIYMNFALPPVSDGSIQIYTYIFEMFYIANKIVLHMRRQVRSSGEKGVRKSTNFGVNHSHGSFVSNPLHDNFLLVA